MRDPIPTTDPARVEVDEDNWLAPAVEWIRERGGLGQVAEDVLKMTAGESTSEVCRAALAKAGAPAGVYGLINVELWARRPK